MWVRRRLIPAVLVGERDVVVVADMMIFINCYYSTAGLELVSTNRAAVAIVDTSRRSRNNWYDIIEVVVVGVAYRGSLNRIRVSGYLRSRERARPTFFRSLRSTSVLFAEH